MVHRSHSWTLRTFSLLTLLSLSFSSPSSPGFIVNIVACKDISYAKQGKKKQQKTKKSELFTSTQRRDCRDYWDRFEKLELHPLRCRPQRYFVLMMRTIFQQYLTNDVGTNIKIHPALGPVCYHRLVLFEHVLLLS